MLELHKNLREAHQSRRLQTLPNINIDLKKVINDVLEKESKIKNSHKDKILSKKVRENTARNVLLIKKG